MMLYAIFAEGYNDIGGKELLENHIYFSKEKADYERQRLYDSEIKRRIELLEGVMKVDPNAKWHYDRLMDEIKNKEFGNLNPLFEVRQLHVKGAYFWRT